jgi:ribosomal protein L40E
MCVVSRVTESGLYCNKCGAQNPDDASFCYKCGSSIGRAQETTAQTPPQSSSADVIAPASATALKCPSCGAPISPKFGEMVITCEYCGASVTLGNQGWKNIQKHTMLPPKLNSKDDVLARIHHLMDHGLLRRHLQESSALEDFNLTVVPYWIIPTAARTSLVATDVAVEAGSIATTAALIGVLGTGMSGGRGRGGGLGGGLAEGMLFGTMMGSTMGGGLGGGAARKAIQFDLNYNYPVVALKALAEYQPHDYQFALQDRTLFDVSNLPKGLKVLNGDVGEDVARYQAKTLVDQLQSEKAHAKYHMIQQIHTDIDVGEGELMHVPIWFARYDHKGSKIVLIVDGNSGNAVSTMGL